MTEKITLDNLTEVPIGELALLPASELYGLLGEALEHFNIAKHMKQRVESAVSLKYETKILAKRQRLNKQTGTVSIEEDDIKVINVVPKKVSWDQGKLAHALVELSNRGEDVSEYVEIKHTIKENVYKDLPDWVQEILDQARVTSTGKANNSLSLIDGRAA